VGSFDNVGIIVFLLSVWGGLVGIVYALFKFRSSYTLTSAMLYISPFLFYVVTLYLGISIILLPGLVPKTFPSDLFNARYGIMMVSFAAVFTGLLYFYLPKF